ncbi:MAG: hypothetical protein ACOC8K_09760 [Gemmatimonadota bacterium]
MNRQFLPVAKLAATVALIGCGVSGSPETFPFASPEPIPEAYDCVHSVVTNAGFGLERDRPDVGILRGTRNAIVTDTIAAAAGGRRIRHLMEWQLLEVEIFEEPDDSSRVEYTVASGNNQSGPWGDPSRDIIEFARTTAERCS